MSKALDITRVTLLAVGDIYITRLDAASAFAGVQSLLDRADFRFGNLEGAICGDLPPLPGKVEAGSGGHLRMPVGTAQGLRVVGFSALSLANNHSMDFGEEGLLQTMDALRRVGIPFAGAGANDSEAHKPCFVEKKGVRIGFIAYTSVYVPLSFPAGPNKPGCAVVNATTGVEFSYNLPYQPGSLPRVLTWANPRDKERMVEDVRQAKEQADLVVVSFHWGQTARGNARSLRIPVELSPCFVCEYQEELGRAAVDAGADLVMGHHPHEVQGLEVYKNSLICYSLGNFVFEASIVPIVRQEEYEAIAVLCTFGGGERPSFSYVPILLSEQRLPRVLSPSAPEAQRIHRAVALHSRKYGTTFAMGKDVVFIQGPNKEGAR